MATSTVVLHVGGLHWATSTAPVEATLAAPPRSGGGRGERG